MSRLLSVTLSHQTSSLLQRALKNVAQRLVLVKYTQTQPVTATAQQPHSHHVNNNTDPGVSVFHRPTKISVDSSEICEKADHATIYCRCSGETVSVGFNENLKESLHNVQQKIRDEAFHDETVKVESVDELLSREVSSVDTYMSLPRLYSKLAKLRLTGLVVTTAVAGYALAPGAFSLSTLLLCAVGTGLMSASANALNQVFEVPYDSQMLRTRSRPLVKVLLSPMHAVCFSAVTGVCGLMTLTLTVNSLSAALATCNLLTYCALYTPMKRLTTSNTSLGAVVGAIPPMIGWAAATATLDIGAWLLAGVMYAWQFPHFCALSWNLRADYSRAGYRMMSVLSPSVCRRQAVHYSLLVTALCLAMPLGHVTTWTFAADSLPLNVYLTYAASRFYTHADSRSARRLFHYTLIHLPALLLLMLLSKKRTSSSSSSPVQQQPRAAAAQAELKPGHAVTYHDQQQHGD